MDAELARTQNERDEAQARVRELEGEVERLWEILDIVWDPAEDCEFPAERVADVIKATEDRDVEALRD